MTMITTTVAFDTEPQADREIDHAKAHIPGVVTTKEPREQWFTRSVRTKEGTRNHRYSMTRYVVTLAHDHASRETPKEA